MVPSLNRYGSKLNQQGTAGFGPCFRLPGFHFGYICLTHRHVTRAGGQFAPLQLQGLRQRAAAGGPASRGGPSPGAAPCGPRFEGGARCYGTGCQGHITRASQKMFLFVLFFLLCCSLFIFLRLPTMTQIVSCFFCFCVCVCVSCRILPHLQPRAAGTRYVHHPRFPVSERYG